MSETTEFNSIQECLDEIKRLIAGAPQDPGNMLAWCQRINEVDCAMRTRIITQLPKMDDHSQAHAYDNFVSNLPLCGQASELYEEFKTAALGPFDKAGNLISSITAEELMRLQVPLMCVTMTKMIRVVENEKPNFMS